MTSFNVDNRTSDKRCPKNYTIGVIEIDSKKELVILDFIKISTQNIRVLVNQYEASLPAIPDESIISNVVFSNYFGEYIIKGEYSEKELINYIYTLGNNRYPYSFAREYEAIRHFDLFKNSARIVSKDIVDDSYITSNIKYSFGLEFETSMGFIPEEECFINGLIPLRDGSITGTEYSTIVLNSKDNAFSTNLLQQQLLSLREHCIFNKECALHIHMGGYPVNPKAIFILHLIERMLEGSLYDYCLPAYSFNTSKYKRNGKDYCQKIKMFYSFDDLYKYYVKQEYYGDLTQPHPNDTTRERKWQIDTRYFSMNLINMLCYDGPKTVEFRFLRPTWNYRKIRFWLLTFNAVLLYSENLFNILKNKEYSSIVEYFISRPISLDKIFKSVYNKDICSILLKEVALLQSVVFLQKVNNDYCGQSIDIENKIFKDII